MRAMVKIPSGLEPQPPPTIIEGDGDAIVVARLLLDADNIIEHKIAEHVYVYTHEQDGTYEYNERLAFVCEKIFGVLTALEGEVCILIEDGAEEHLLK
jgi:hypothetical protein